LNKFQNLTGIKLQLQRCNIESLLDTEMQIKKITGFILWLIIIILTTISAAFYQENILLITYGKDAYSIEGDNDYEQEIIIRVPKKIKNNLYMRIFDPDVGGSLDDKYNWSWNTRTRFEFSGANNKIISGEEFGVDSKKDKKWYTLARFNPDDGELQDDYYIFKLHVKGLAGDDGNIFDLFVSRYSDKNQKQDGVVMLNYEPTVRLPEKQETAELRFFIPEEISEINVRNFDLADADIKLTTAFRSDLEGTSSGQGEWIDSKITLMDIEAGRWGALKYSGGNETPNDATFVLIDHKKENVPVQLPILIPKRANHRPIPEIHVTYLPDCYSVSFDASKSEDPDGDNLAYFWKFGDGKTGKGIRVTHKYNQKTDFEVTLIVADDSRNVDNSALITERIHINLSPVAQLSVKSSEVSETSELFRPESAHLTGDKIVIAPEQEIVFDGSASSDSDGDIQEYLWNFGDGKTGSGEKISHSFKKSGIYKIKLTVKDDSQSPCNTDTAVKEILVNSQPLVKIDKNKITGAVGESLLFEAVQTCGVFKTPQVFCVKDIDGEIVRYLWNFGDGTEEEGKNVKHSYLQPGKYTAMLTVEDNSCVSNSSASDRMIVIINDPPVPKFEARNAKQEVRTRFAAGETIYFDGSASFDNDGKIISYSWDFGDSVKSSEVSETSELFGPEQASGVRSTHKYDRPGTYQVVLTVQDDSGTLSASESESLSVIINDPPVPKFIIQNSKFEAKSRFAPGETVYFDASESYDSDGAIISYSWDFGDSIKSSEVSKTSELFKGGVKVTHIYDHPGTYQVILTVQDESETISSIRSEKLSVIVNQAPEANAGPDQRVTASEIHFDGTGSTDSDGKITDYHWDFGDGETGNGAAPVHIFKNPGTYHVKLTVKDDSETGNNQASDEMTVIINHKPIADAGPDQIGSPGETISFNGDSSYDPDGKISTYKWDFGDGESGSGEKVSHIYKKTGRYMVQLTVTDDTNHNNAIDKDNLILFINAPPVAKIHSLINAQLKVDTLTLSPPYKILIAAPGQEITLDAGNSYDSDGNIVEYRWDFPMLKTSEVSETSEVFSETEKLSFLKKLSFSAPGINRVILTVKDDNGAISQDRILIRINHSPEARAGIRNQESGMGKSRAVICERSVQFDGSASADPDGDPLSYLWDFGDGTPQKSGINVIHTYKEGGTYPVMLTADDGTGLENSKHTSVFTLKINEHPVADVGKESNIFKSGVCAGDVVVFSGGSSYDPDGGALKYYWDFGDSTTADGFNPIKIFKRGGYYQVTLTVEDDSGLTCNRASDQMVIRVMESPVADAGDDMVVCANTEVHFDGSKSYDTDGVVNSFVWDFGDGSVANGIKPVHIYKESGIYLVKLTITGDPIGFCNNEDSAAISVTVQESPESIFTYPLFIHAGGVAEFDGSASKGNGSEIVSWDWDFGDGKSGSGAAVSHLYQNPGRYPVALTIKTDAKSRCNLVTTQKFIVVNAQPVADAGEEIFTGIDQTIVFNGSKSHDPDGSIVAYQWDFGDGATSTGMEVSHAYLSGGRYPVLLKVRDNTETGNNQAEDKIWVTVNHTPRAEFRSQKSVCAGEKFILSAEKSTDPDGDMIKSKKSRYYWNFGDGKSDEGLTVSHSYKTPGKYQITLIADDGTGVSNSRNETQEWIKVNYPPTADAGLDKIACPGEAVTFDASASGDTDGTILKYHWNFDGSKSEEGKTVTHLFDKPGKYKVNLAVSDDSETSCNTDEDTVWITVNTPPVADAGSDQNGYIGGAHDALFFDAGGSSDADGDPIICYWDFGDGNYMTGAQVFHTYTQPGTYKVSLKVNDGAGTGCSEVLDELTVQVQNHIKKGD